MAILRSVIVTLFTMIFCENFIFSRAIGTSTLISLSRNKRSAAGFAVSVVYMSMTANALAWTVKYFFGGSEYFRYFQPVLYVIIMAVVYFLSLLFVWKFINHYLESMRKYLHYAAFNSAVMGIMLFSSGVCVSLMDYIVYGIGAGVGYSLAVYLTSIVYDRIYSKDVPESFRGFPLLMIYVGILSMAFFGLTGNRLPINY